MRSLRILANLSLVALFVSLNSQAESGGASTDIVGARAAGKAMNPDTGANFLGLYRKGTLGNDPASANPNGFVFQEAELQFTADVDPYFRAVALFSIAPDGKDFSIDPEEVYAESISLPSITLRLGKFKVAMGRHNVLHTHAFPFIDAPLINQQLLGAEGLNDTGAGASALLPAPWFMELTAQAFAGKSDTLYASPNPNALAGAAQLKNLWDLTEDSTLEMDLFGTTGSNRYESNSYVYGADLTVKWRPSNGGKYKSLAWTSEYLNGLIAGNTVGGSPAFGARLGGMASWLQYQFAERWWAQARAEFLGLPHEDAVSPVQKQSLLLGFFPSEFSGFRLQYDHRTQDDRPVDHAVALQWNISIGAHPAHAY